MSARRRGRGKQGRIDGFAGTHPEIKERIDALLQGGVSQAEILRRLEDPLRAAGERPLSAAGLSRYSSRMSEVAAELREIGEFADTWKRHLGDEPVGDVTAMTVHVMQAHAFRKAMQLRRDDEGEGDGEAASTQAFNELALAISRIERTAGLNAAREREIRRELAAVAAEQAAESAAREAGDALPAEALERIRRDVYGIHDAA